MLQTLNFESLPHAAFLRGLAKGLAAPLMLYGDFAAPIVIPPVQAVHPVRLRAQTRSDWEAVGDDLRVAMSRYEKERQ
jgi:hypothetical protein